MFEFAIKRNINSRLVVSKVNHFIKANLNKLLPYSSLKLRTCRWYPYIWTAGYWELLW